jgi:hypothetical protein
VTSCKTVQKAASSACNGPRAWPCGALDACQRIEAEHPGWHAWWGDGDHGPGYYAHPLVCTAAGTLYADNAYVLYSLIQLVEVGAP